MRPRYFAGPEGGVRHAKVLLRSPDDAMQIDEGAGIDIAYRIRLALLAEDAVGDRSECAIVQFRCRGDRRLGADAETVHRAKHSGFAVSTSLAPHF